MPTATSSSLARAATGCTSALLPVVLRFVETLRGAGGVPGPVTTGPSGTILTASGQGLQRVLGDGTAQRVVAHWPRGRGPHRRFFPAFGLGVAAEPDGQVFVDTDSFDSFPDQGLLAGSRAGGSAGCGPSRSSGGNASSQYRYP